MSLDGFSLVPLVKELAKKLVGGRIDKITQPNKQTVIISVRQPGQNLLLQISINPQNPSVHLISHAPENPAEPPIFCMVLRKQLDAGRIAAIRQRTLDRMISIDIDTLAAGGKIVTKTLVLELVGKYSNIILVADGIITESLRRVGANSSRVRLVLPGLPYEYPPGQDKLNPFNTAEDVMLDRICSQESAKLSKAILGACLGFGPVSAKETSFLAGLPPTMLVSDMDDNDKRSLTNAIKEICDLNMDPAQKPCAATDVNGKITALSSFPLHYMGEDIVLHTFDTISELLEYADERMRTFVLPDKARFQKLVKNELARAKRKLDVLYKEQDEAENADTYKVYGDNLMTYQYQIDPHISSATVQDIYSTNGEEITIPLDPKYTIIQNMQRCYRKYDKLKRAQELLVGQIESCKESITYLETIETSLLSSESISEINEIHQELTAAGYLHEKPKKRSSNDKPARPFRFMSPSGMEILVGKNNIQNDKLTTKIARPGDLWLHTKEIPGSHVILRTNGNEPTEDDLLIAASLAAHFSKASGSSNIPVDCTDVRYVKKPSGAKPGFVIFTHQRTLAVTPDEEKLKSYLENDLNA